MGYSPQISNFPCQQGFPPSRIYYQKFHLVFLTLLTNFPTIFWALPPPVIFLTSFGYIFLYIFCGDPKMGYNRCPLFIMLTEQRFCAVSFIKINQNWAPKTDLVGARLLWSFVLTSILLNPKTMIKIYYLEIPSGDLLNQNL